MKDDSPHYLGDAYEAEPEDEAPTPRFAAIVSLIAILAIVAAFIWGICAIANLAHAKPPEGLVPNPQVQAWFKTLYPEGGAWAKIPCCDISDCRVVDTRPVGTGIEAYIRKGDGYDAFEDGDNQWHEVPPQSILHNKANMLGQPIACWHWNMVLCFLDGGAT